MLDSNPTSPDLTTTHLLRDWRRRELDEDRARYQRPATDPGWLSAPHRRVSAALAGWLVRRALNLAAYGRRRPAAHIVAELLDARLLSGETSGERSQ